MSARKNPDGKQLKDILPPDLYARWSVLKARYIGRDDAIESWRPLFAAMQLYSKAIDQTGLDRHDIVQPEVSKLAKQHDLKVTDPAIKVELDKPRAAIKEFAKVKLSDVDCLAATIARLESDLSQMRSRANAWARGDVHVLEQLPFTSQRDSCLAAVMGAETVQERGLQDLPTRVLNNWVAAATLALRNNKSSFAVMSMDDISRPDGKLAALRAKGFVVEDP
jgi:TraB/PrgY/gumN family